MAASVNVKQNDEDCDSCTFNQSIGIEKKLQICLCEEEKCLLGQGAYGRVYKGKWKEDPEASESIDVAVKHPTGPYHVDYEIAALTKANGHDNILKFYGQIRYPPNRYV